MHDLKKINVMEGILDENDHIAAHVNERLTAHGVLCVNQMGAPGVGKTTVLKNIIANMTTVKACVIEGDIESDIDAQELHAQGIRAYQVNTFGACHLDAPMIHNMVGSINLEKTGVLFIENIGNLVCPAEFAIGEHVKMLITAVTEGSDKPYKYPIAFEKADIIILNKIDLLPHVDFDEAFYMKGIRALNSDVPVFHVSGRNGEGFEAVAEWFVEERRKVKRGEHRGISYDHHRHHHDHAEGDHHHHESEGEGHHHHHEHE